MIFYCYFVSIFSIYFQQLCIRVQICMYFFGNVFVFFWYFLFQNWEKEIHGIFNRFSINFLIFLLYFCIFFSIIKKYFPWYFIGILSQYFLYIFSNFASAYKFVCIFFGNVFVFFWYFLFQNWEKEIHGIFDRFSIIFLIFLLYFLYIFFIFNRFLFS